MSDISLVSAGACVRSKKLNLSVDVTGSTFGYLPCFQTCSGCHGEGHTTGIFWQNKDAYQINKRSVKFYTRTRKWARFFLFKRRNKFMFQPYFSYSFFHRQVLSLCDTQQELVAGKKNPCNFFSVDVTASASNFPSSHACIMGWIYV